MSSLLLCTQMLIQDMWAKCAIAVWGLCWCNFTGMCKKNIEIAWISPTRVGRTYQAKMTRFYEEEGGHHQQKRSKTARFSKLLEDFHKINRDKEGMSKCRIYPAGSETKGEHSLGFKSIGFRISLLLKCQQALWEKFETYRQRPLHELQDQ